MEAETTITLTKEQFESLQLIQEELSSRNCNLKTLLPNINADAKTGFSLVASLDADQETIFCLGQLIEEIHPESAATEEPAEPSAE